MSISLVVFIGWILIIGFVWFRGGFSSGRRFGNQVAKHLGWSKNFFHSVLDNGMANQSLAYLNMLQRSGLTPEQAAVSLAPQLARGLHLLEERFGRQNMIEEAKPSVNQLIQAWEASQKLKP